MNPSAINSSIGTSLSKIVSVILVPIVELVFAAAVVLFVWGAAGLVLHAEEGEERTKSQQHIMYGLFGMFIMLGCYGIVRLIANTIGVQAPF